MLGKIEGRRRRWRRMRWLDGITDSMDMSFRKLWSWWWAGRSGVLQSMGSQSQAWLSDWTELRNHWNSIWVLQFDVLKNPVLYLKFLLSHFKSTYSWNTWMCTENSQVRASRCFQTLSCRVLGIPSLDLRGRGMGQRDLEHHPGANGKSSIKSVLHAVSMCKILFIERALLVFVFSLFEKHSFTI